MPRNFRAYGVAMNSEMLYAFLMGTGWFFLMGWLLAVVVAYAKAFQGDQADGWANPSTKSGRLKGNLARIKLP